jgi:putative transposase
MLGELVRAVLERALEPELTAHLGYGRGGRGGSGGNARNGKSPRPCRPGSGRCRCRCRGTGRGRSSPRITPRRDTERFTCATPS